MNNMTWWTIWHDKHDHMTNNLTWRTCMMYWSIIDRRQLVYSGANHRNWQPHLLMQWSYSWDPIFHGLPHSCGGNQWVNTVEPHPAETYEKWPFTILWTLHLVLIVLTFLNIVWQQRGPKMRPRCFQLPEYTLPCLPEVYRNPLKYRHFPITEKTTVIPTVPTLDGFHCSWKFRQCNS